MFWTCSRIWSISTLSSTAARLVRASTDFGVLASRLNYGAEIQAPAHRLALGEHAADLVDVAGRRSAPRPRPAAMPAPAPAPPAPVISCQLGQPGRAGSLSLADIRHQRHLGGDTLVPSTAQDRRYQPGPSRSRPAMNSSSTVSAAPAPRPIAAGSAPCDCSTPGTAAVPPARAAPGSGRRRGQFAQARHGPLVQLGRRLSRAQAQGPVELAARTRANTRSQQRSNARSSSGRRRPSSRNRWFTARSSQPSVPQGVLRSPDA